MFIFKFLRVFIIKEKEIFLKNSYILGLLLFFRILNSFVFEKEKDMFFCRCCIKRNVGRGKRFFCLFSLF